MASPKTQDIVMEFCQDKGIRENLLYIASSKTFFLYDEARGFYRHVSEEKMELLAYEFTKGKDKNISKNFLRDFVHLAGLQCYEKIDEMPKRYIAMSDKLLDMETFDFEKFSRERYAHFSVHCASDQLKEDAPMFHKFLGEVLVDDAGKRDDQLLSVLQEMAGYYLLPDLRPGVMFFLLGNGANGKSVFINLLTEIIGREFISALSLQTITTNRFALTGLIGKRVNISGEEESKYMSGAKFKALITGDAIEGERKFGGTFTLYPSTKFLFATNNVPLFERIDPAIKRRIRIIPFKRMFSEKERDLFLTKKLLTELPGIIGWAIGGAKRLVANGYVFSESRAVEKEMTEFENAISGAAMFVRELFVEDAESFISNGSLYTDYTLWCDKNGRKPMNSSNFQKDITRLYGKESIIGWDKETQHTVRGRNLRSVAEIGHEGSQGGDTAPQRISF
jgi:putative DNA primase/helicase